MNNQLVYSTHLFAICSLAIMLLISSCSKGRKLQYSDYTSDGINRVPLNSLYDFAEYEDDIKHYMEATFSNGIIDTACTVSIITGPISHTFYVQSVDSLLNLRKPMSVSISKDYRIEMRLLNDTLQLLYYENLSGGNEDREDLSLVENVLLYGNESDSTILYLTREIVDSESNHDKCGMNRDTKELYTYPLITEVKHYTLQYNHNVDIMDFVPKSKRNVIGLIGSRIDSPDDLMSLNKIMNKSWNGTGRITLKKEHGNNEYEL